MRHIKKHKLLIWLFTPLFILFLFAVVMFLDSITNTRPVRGAIRKAILPILKIVNKDKSAVVICDNCDISQIKIKYPYSLGYHIADDKIFYCQTDKSKNIVCELIKANNQTFKILNKYFAHDDKNIYCESQIVGDYHGQKIGYNTRDEEVVTQDYIQDYIQDEIYYYIIENSSTLDYIEVGNHNYIKYGPCVKYKNSDLRITNDFQHYE